MVMGSIQMSIWSFMEQFLPSVIEIVGVDSAQYLRRVPWSSKAMVAMSTASSIILCKVCVVCRTRNLGTFGARTWGHALMPAALSSLSLTSSKGFWARYTLFFRWKMSHASWKWASCFSSCFPTTCNFQTARIDQLGAFNKHIFILWIGTGRIYCP